MRRHRSADAPPSFPHLEAPPASALDSVQYAAELHLISTLLKAVDQRLERIEAILDRPAQMTHEAMPHQDTALHPVFDDDGREIDYGTQVFVSYPLRGTCQCGQNIMRLSPLTAWQHD